MTEYAVQYAKAVEPESAHAAFARRINATPDDPLPALVWADYLDDAGLGGAAEVVRRHYETYPRPRISSAPGGGRGEPDYDRKGLDAGLISDGRGGLSKETGRYTVFVSHPTGVTSHPWTSHLYFEVSATPKEAHRLLSAMPNLAGAEAHVRRLEQRHPKLKPTDPTA